MKPHYMFSEKARPLHKMMWSNGEMGAWDRLKRLGVGSMALTQVGIGFIGMG